MKRWSKVLIVVVLLGGIGASWHIFSTHPASPDALPAAAPIVKDVHKPWSPAWIGSGLPPQLRENRNWKPWVIADPEMPAQTWWLWPVVSHHSLWFGQSVPSGVQWTAVSLRHPDYGALPIPWQEVLAWSVRLQHGESAPSVVAVTSKSAWTAEAKQAASIAGGMMAMETRNNTAVLALLLHTRTAGAGWIELVSIWQYKQHWIPQYLIVNPVPRVVSAKNLLMPPGAGIPPIIPQWAKGSS